MKEYRILSPTGIVGYGFPAASFEEGVRRCPDLIACDGGSTDPGPYYLGSGNCFTDRTAVKRDMEMMLLAARKLDIPLVIGSAGGSGAKPHVEREIGVIREIAKEHALSFRMTVIWADFEKSYLIGKMHEGKIHPLGPVPEITEEEIESSTNIVAQMGNGPIMKALSEGADVVLCGRCYDPAAFAAPPILAGYDPGLAIHLGKVLECAAIAATPGSGRDCMMGYLGEDYFRVEPLNPTRKCTPLSISAHTLYEKSNPYLLPGPDGVLDLRGCTFTEDGERGCRVTGSKLDTSGVRTVKLEGTKCLGYRTLSIAGNRDPVFIAHLDEVLENVKAQTAENFAGRDISYELNYIVYGRDGVMGALEPKTSITSHEIGIVIDVVGRTQEEANAVCSVARSAMLHYGYEGRIATAGNLAFPFSPSDIKAGAVYGFSVYHLLETEGETHLFPSEKMVFEAGEEI